MQSHKKILISLLAVAMLGIGLPVVAAQGSAVQYQYSAGISELSTADLEIRVTGAGQPHFHWWSPVTEDVDYHLRFISLFEANDTDDDGVFTRGTDDIVGPRFMLPTENWEFSDFVVEEEGDNVTAVHFNFTTTSEHDPRPGGAGGDYGQLPSLAEFDVMVQLRVHLYTETPNEVKFDVVIDGWNWTYDDSILVMQYTITESNHGQGQSEGNPNGFQRTGTKFSFSDGYMEYNETALAAQNTLEVKASYGDGIGQEAGESVYLAFEYFSNETLEYDPIIGIEVAITEPLLDATSLLIFGGAIVVVVVLAIVLKMRK